MKADLLQDCSKLDKIRKLQKFKETQLLIERLSAAGKTRREQFQAVRVHVCGHAHTHVLKKGEFTYILSAG
jgi:hypothetical protein